MRLIRVVRVLRLVRALPKLRVLVLGLAQALSSIGYIAMLLGLLYYFFAVLAVSLYAKNDPIGMGTLHVAFLSLFQAGTLEDWTDVMYTQIEGCEVYGYSGHQDQCIWSDPQPLLATIFFVSFCVLANLLVLNLFIGGACRGRFWLRSLSSIANALPPHTQSFSSPWRRPSSSWKRRYAWTWR